MSFPSQWRDVLRKQRERVLLWEAELLGDKGDCKVMRPCYQASEASRLPQGLSSTQPIFSGSFWHSSLQGALRLITSTGKESNDFVKGM